MATLKKWIEIKNGDEWRAYDEKNYQFGFYKDEKYMPWWFGLDNHFIDVQGGSKVNVKVAVKKNSDDAVSQALLREKGSDWILSFSFFGFPVDTQLVFKVLLLIPVGGLIIVILRQLVGLKTFGTFMPVLVALSFRETQLFWGAILFTVIVFLGLMFRAYFDRLQLLAVPRIASVLTIVILLISFVTFATYKLGISAGLSIGLFPIVILAMTIERISIIWEEAGPEEATRIGFETLVCSIIAYLFMYHPTIEHMVFVFPELLLVILAFTILLGKYNGYKLMEYFRFKTLDFKD
jgi:hypothetical protein